MTPAAARPAVPPRPVDPGDTAPFAPVETSPERVAAPPVVLDPSLLVRTAFLFYGPLALGCGAWLVWRQGSSFVRPVPDPAAALWGMILGLAVVLFSAIAARLFRWADRLEAEFVRLLGPLDGLSILVLAGLSSVGEEWLFRGLLLPWTGLWVSTLLFALAHPPLNEDMRAWTVFAAAMGWALGLLTLRFDSLWPAVIAHAVVNGLNLARMSWRAKRGAQPQTSREEGG